MEVGFFDSVQSKHGIDAVQFASVAGSDKLTDENA